MRFIVKKARKSTKNCDFLFIFLSKYISISSISMQFSKKCYNFVVENVYCNEWRRWNMISNQILQNTIEGLKGITKIDFCVMDTEGKVLAGTFAEQVNQGEEVRSFVESPADSQVIKG